ncbi:MAG: dihydropyrimidinase [Anaerolineaceae bacterium]|nr:dihydropyrimidinase [Anaerolineaceae bacterium]
MKQLIKYGTVVTASDTVQVDILLDGEKIALLGENIVPTGDMQVVDAKGKYVLPGGVDVHTHFDLPMFGTVSSDNHYTGHKAAAFGGTTTVIDFVPMDDLSLKKMIDQWHTKAEKAAIDYGFHMNITKFGADVLKQIPGLLDEGISSVKVFTAYNNNMRLMDDQIFEVMRVAAKHQMLTMAHVENGDVIDLLVNEALAEGHTAPIYHAETRPSWGAVEASLRAVALSAMAEAPLYLVHMNAGGEVDQLAYAKDHGLAVYGETCPQYLFFSTDDLRKPDGAKWVCSPPMRTKNDADRLWDGISDGTIDVMGTDHCAFYFDGRQSINYEGVPIAIPGKELGIDDFTKIPNGLPGVGDRMPVLWTKAVNTGILSFNQFVAINCTNPAKLFGLYPKKGCILPGADADIVIWDPDKQVKYGVEVAQHRTDYNLYQDWLLTGFPETVFLRGRKIVDDGNWLGERGYGEFQYRKTFSKQM